LVCDYERPDSHIIDEAVRTLTEGLVAVIPTETQYALSVRADLGEAPEIIRGIKKRSETVRTAVFIKDLEMARSFCEVSELAQRLAEKFLPGPLTLILPGRENRGAIATGFVSEDGIGIRISSSPLVSAVMQQVSFPVTATSANLSGETSPAMLVDIKRMLGEDVDLYLDAGACQSLIPSTVVKINGKPQILRPGLVSRAALETCLKKVQ
jgi:L-threonylcarbamoyladenylate synthase